MAAATSFETIEPARSVIDALSGAVVLEFGTAWCGWCNAAKPLIATALSSYDKVRHIKVEDGSGRPLGRSFRIKLWPTLIFLRDGKEFARLTRPNSTEQIERHLKEITGD